MKFMWEESVKENSHGLCTSSRMVFCKRGCIESMQSRTKKNSHFLPADTETKPWLASSKHLLLGMPKSHPVFLLWGCHPWFCIYFQSRYVLQSGGNITVSIHMERFYPDYAWPLMFIEVEEIRFWWTKGLHSFVSLPPGIFMTCIDNTNQPWQQVRIVTIGLWLLASQQSCQGQFIQQHWLIWQEAAYLSLEPGTDKPWL